MALLQNILIIIQLLPFLKAINPIFTPCDTDANTTTVDCSYRPFSQVPVIKSTTIISIDLSYTKIKQVGQDSFLGVPNLNSLAIMWNCQPGSLQVLNGNSCKMVIDRHAFKNLLKLRILYLPGNSLTSIPWLPESLRVLDLQYNHIFSITHPLKTPQLEQLLLNRNCYYVNPCHQPFYINESVFRELPKLRNLTLGYNNLTELPAGLPPSLESLDLRENTITRIPEGAFANFTFLRDLNLEWNCQRCDHAARPCFPCPQNLPLHLYPKSFYAENSSITTLSLRGNSLRTIPAGLFQPMRKLKKLDLSDNLLSYAIRNGTFFSELKGLTSISLIYNYEPLKTFPELILSPHLGNISGLQTLLLSGNFFHALSTDSIEVLSKLKNLQSLDLRMNFINQCNLTLLKLLPSLVKVVLSQNMLTFLPHCPCPSAEYASQLGGQNQNSYSNSLPKPPFMLFDREVVSSDQLEPDRINLFEMSEDDVKIPNIWNFKKQFCQHNLTVDLSQNDILYLNNYVFVGMDKTVCLDLSYNYMSQTLKKGVFGNMTNLVYLNMAFNRIDLYYGDAFSELDPSLKVLDLSNNQFHFQMMGMGHRFEFLQHLTNLEVLSMANNGIGVRIDRGLISSSLKYLYFSGNQLDVMWGSDNNRYTHFFKNLSNLVYLDISENGLRSISPDVLCSLPRNIKALSVSKNRLEYFPWENITALSNLCHLNLSQNYLAYLPHVAIQFGRNLSLLDLSHNKIIYVPTTFFSNLVTLRYLYLSHNKIKQLNHQSLPVPFKNGSALQKLTLHANPFKCDCDMSWFADFLRTTSIKVPHLTTNIHCEFPESLQGESVLLMDQHSCQDIYGSLAFLISSFVVVIFTVLPLLKYLYGWNLWYCMQVLWAGLKGYTQLPGSNHYDAFVVFDTQNKAVREWVYNELTVHLETLGYRRFCLCLEERDWIPGLSCIENLHNAIYSSVKTVFVLSSGGSNAKGGEMVNGVIRQAFFMVQQRLLDEKVDVAVLVLLDEMFPKLKYLQLRKRLCRKSVMSWPRNPNAQPLFWNRMRMALSSDNLNFYDNNMSEGFL